MLKTECPKCQTTMYPEVGDPVAQGATRSPVTCTHCGHQLGTLDWTLAP